jgi:pre-mRNA-splicing factor 38B
MGKAPSTAFCIIFRMCTLGLTRTELKKMLKRKDSPYLRACAMLYMRYTLVNEMLWEQFEPLLDDPTEFVAGFDKNCTMYVSFASFIIFHMLFFMYIFFIQFDWSVRRSVAS